MAKSNSNIAGSHTLVLHRPKLFPFVCIASELQSQIYFTYLFTWQITTKKILDIVEWKVLYADVLLVRVKSIGKSSVNQNCKSWNGAESTSNIDWLYRVRGMHHRYVNWSVSLDGLPSNIYGTVAAIVYKLFMHEFQDMYEQPCIPLIFHRRISSGFSCSITIRDLIKDSIRNLKCLDKNVGIIHDDFTYNLVIPYLIYCYS